MSKVVPFNHSRLAREFWLNGRAADCPIIDVHGHMGAHYAIYFPIAEAEKMVVHLERANAKLVFSHHWPLFTPGDFGNRETYEIVRRFPERLRMYIGINPHFPEAIRRDLDRFEEWRPYAVGLKFLADYHCTPVTDPKFAPALEFADAHALPALFHTWGGSVCDGPKPMREIIERYPNMKFLLGHSYSGEWDEAIRIVRDYPERVFLELTSIPGRAGTVEYLVAGAGSANILLGTDLPWFDEFQAVGGILGTTLGEDDIRNILYRNAQKLFPGF